MKIFYTFCVIVALGTYTANAQIKVIGSLVPNGTADKYPTHSDTYGKGGFRGVANVAERDAITTARRSLGMLVYAVAENKFYQLKGGVENTNWTEVNIGGTGGMDPAAVVAIINGGTGATSAEQARANLGLKSMALQDSSAVDIIGGVINGTAIGGSAPVAGAFTKLIATEGLAVKGEVEVDGGIKATGDVTAFSDIRLKKNIKVIPRVSESLRKIQAVEFDRRDMNLHQIGFIAQNIQQYFPVLVKAAADKRGTLSVNYQGLTSPLLKGWQEHDEEISQLKTEVEQLKKELKELKGMLLLNNTKGQK